jgi:hypothetical protein
MVTRPRFGALLVPLGPQRMGEQASLHVLHVELVDTINRRRASLSAFHAPGRSFPLAAKSVLLSVACTNFEIERSPFID